MYELLNMPTHRDTTIQYLRDLKMTTKISPCSLRICINISMTINVPVLPIPALQQIAENRNDRMNFSLVNYEQEKS